MFPLKTIYRHGFFQKWARHELFSHNPPRAVASDCSSSSQRPMSHFSSFSITFFYLSMSRRILFAFPSVAGIIVLSPLSRRSILEISCTCRGCKAEIRSSSLPLLR